MVKHEDSMEVDEPQVKLKSSDNKRFTLNRVEASCSNALRSMFEANCGVPPTEYINLPVHSRLLVKVIEWCNHNSVHIDGDELDDWEKNFLGTMPEGELFELMHVANYLDVRKMFDGCCQTIGKRWEGKKVDEIRKMYNIKSDFTPEEETQMIQESKRLGLDS